MEMTMAVDDGRRIMPCSTKATKFGMRLAQTPLDWIYQCRVLAESAPSHASYPGHTQ